MVAARVGLNADPTTKGEPLKRWFAVVLLVCASMATTAQADSGHKSIHTQSVHKFGKKAVRHYDALHKWSVRQNREATGLSITKWGTKGKGGRHVASKAQFRATLSTLERWKNPPPAPRMKKVSYRPQQQQVQQAQVQQTQQPQQQANGGGGAGGNLGAIRQCESGGNYSTNTGNGYYGAYQFTQSTWESVGGSGNPAAAPPAEQDQRAAQLYSSAGAGQWPVCGR